MANPKPILNSHLKTALVYDRINTPYGGAEQVLLALHQLFPKAPVFTSVYNPRTTAWADELDVRPSFLQKIPFARHSHRRLLPLMPLAFEQLNLDEFELIISVTSAEAKGIITKPDQLHLCYLLTPPRYLYSHRSQYLQAKSILKLPVFKQTAEKLLDYIRWWDQAAMHRPDAIVPLSQLVQKRVRRYYQNVKTLDPIYPPVDAGLNSFEDNDTGSTSLSDLNLPAGFNLVVSRLVPYKRIDLAVSASAELNQPLVVVGTGPELSRLKRLAQSISSPTIFLGNQSQTIVDKLLKRAELVLSPGQDDFGLTPLQANLQGTPVVINTNSGVAEVIPDEVGGIHIQEETTAGVARAIIQAGQTEFDSDIIKQLARNYTTDKFLLKFKNVVQTIVSEKLATHI